MLGRSSVASAGRSLNTYYVSNAGNNAANGTSPTTPWQTIAKVNATSFPTGSKVLLKRGDTWRESLLFPSSSMTVGAYGTGNKPRLTGGSLLSTWGGGSGGIYTATLAYDPKILTVNGTAATKAAALAGLPNGQWFWATNTLSYRSDAGSPTTLGLQMDAPARPRVVQAVTKTGITVRDIQIDLSADQAVLFDTCTGATIKNCDILNTTKGVNTTANNGGITFASGSGSLVYGCYIRNVVDTVTIYGWQTQGCEIAYCDTFSQLGGEENTVHLDGGTTPSEGYKIHHNLFDMGTSGTGKHLLNLGQGTNGGSAGGGYVGYNTAIGANGSFSINNSGSSGNPIIIEYNTCKNYGQVLLSDWSAGVFMPSTFNQNYITIRNNIFYNGTNGMWSSDAGAETTTRLNMIIENNTFHQMDYKGILFGNQFGGIIRNNIISNCSTGVVQVNQIAAGNTLTLNYDCLNPAATNFVAVTGTNYSTLTAVRGAGRETNGMVANPLLVDPANGNFALGSGSPCIGTSSTGGNIGAL